MTHTERPSIICSGSPDSLFSFQFGDIEIKGFLFLGEKLLFLHVVKKSICLYDNYLRFVSFFSVD